MDGNCLICLEIAIIDGNGNGNDDENDNEDGEESNRMALSRF